MQKHDAGHRGVLYRALIGEKGKKIVDLISSRESCSVTNREGEGAARWVPPVSERRRGPQLSATERKKGEGGAHAAWPVGPRCGPKERKGEGEMLGCGGKGKLGRPGSREVVPFFFYFFFNSLFFKGVFEQRINKIKSNNQHKNTMLQH